MDRGREGPVKEYLDKSPWRREKGNNRHVFFQKVCID
jgi:hypothetical protein